MSFGKLFKKVIKYSNPVTAAIDVAQHALGSNVIKDPKLSMFGGSIDLANIAPGTNPLTAIGEGMNVAANVDNAQQKAKARKQESQDFASDQATFDKFSEQDLLTSGDPTGDLMLPTFKRNQALADKTASIVSLFNNRKSQILNQRAAPGISQTRF